MHVRRPLVSEEEFLQLPESSTKLELIDGEVIVSPAPSPQHQEVLRRLLRALETWLAGRPERERPMLLFAPVDIRFRRGRILQPDIAIWTRAFELPENGPIDAVPDVCAEILSGDRVHDRVTKRLIYAESGVKELWIVERRGPLERWSGERLDDVEEISERLTSPLFPGLDVDLSAVFWR